ncbi:MAG TPA: HAMP domain-containing sensor histidine kinase [Solirubrobacteraceae bacterium]|jgi:two-component system sensor histidine kinase MprB|nr:HAMP domain-containing sensor histidine kinase [Solirubrobacteraceae bacterium]
MSFRRRITIVSAAAVAIAVVLAATLTYVLTSNQLHGLLDTQLRERARARSELIRAGDAKGLGGDALRRRARRNIFSGLPPGPDQVRGYQQMINAKGSILVRSAQRVSLPVDAATRALAAHGGKPVFRDATVNGIHLRVLAESLSKGQAVQFAQPLTEVDSLLERLRLILALLVVGGIALAAVLGRLVAGAAVQPLKRLTNAAEHVALTRDLSGRIEPSGDDELGRLARSFNAMLDALGHSINALDASVHAQRQLVADASHELRTPVTSLRTNIEILQQQGQDMDPEDSSRLLSDVVQQIEELTLLMNDLIDLARGEEPRAGAEELRLDLLVGEVLERARRHAPATPLHAQLQPTLLTGVPARLERAIGNLIDNAVKYSPPGEPVEIRLQDGELSVRDHGPGISDEDLPYIFDRFYRGAEARGRPGSGLGLAIVQQVAVQQGGSVTAGAAPGGGTLMRLQLPGTEALEDVEADGDRGAGDLHGSAVDGHRPVADGQRAPV